MITKSRELLGTIIEITLPTSKLFDECFDEIERIEKKYSRFIENSYLSKLNSKKEDRLDEETIFLLKKAVKIKIITKNYFDINIKETLESLGYDKDYSFKKKIKINNPFKKKGFEIKDKKITLYNQIDFGGIGKGYAIDRVKKILEKNKIKKYFINAGGDIYSKGKNRIALENPDNNKYAIGEVEINDESICSSSSNRRKWGKNHHLIDPFTKKSTNSIKTVFIIEKNAIDGDALATGLFCSGFENAIEISKKNNLKVLLISNDNKIFTSKNFNWKKY